MDHHANESQGKGQKGLESGKMAASSDDDKGAKARESGSVSLIIEYLERGTLFTVILLTVGAIALEIIAVIERQTVIAADILLLLLYTEVLSMVRSYYVNRQIPVLYPLIISITAIARLIVLQGKDMDPVNILIEAAAILVLVIAILMLSSDQVRRKIDRTIGGGEDLIDPEKS